MSIRPIDMQVSVNKTTMINKSHNTQSNLDRALVGESTQRQIDKHVEQNMKQVVKSSKEKKEVNKDGHNKQKYEARKQRDKKRKEEEQKKKPKTSGESFFDIGV